MDENGVVEISGTVDPSSLLKMLEKAGSRAEVRWFQFGDCSSNLFLPNNPDGRFLQPVNLSRPNPAALLQPSGSAHNHKKYDYQITSSAHNPKHGYPIPYNSHIYDYDQYAAYYHHDRHYPHNNHYNHHYQNYGRSHEHDCQHKYGQIHDGQKAHWSHERDYQYKYGQMHDGQKAHYIRSLDGEDIGCCRVM